MENLYQDESFDSIESYEKVLLDLTQMGNKTRCKYHPKQEVILICLQSQWHTEELCVDCVQQHNESHKQQGQTANMQKIDEVMQECKDKIDTYMEQYKQISNRIEEKQTSLKENYSDQFTQQLDIFEEEAIHKLQQQFLQVKKQYMAKIEDFVQDKKQLLNIIKKDLKGESEKIKKKLETYENNPIKAVKEIYFKNYERDLTHQTQKEQDYELYQPQIKIMRNDEKLQQALDNISQTFYIKVEQENKSKSKFSEKSSQQKLKEKIKIDIDLKKEAERVEKKAKQLDQGDKKTKCPVCRNQMVYVSNFKKHLTCLNCKNVKRLYQDKPNSIQNK